MYVAIQRKEGSRMDVFHERCAGLDVHKEVIYVCALIGRGSGYQKFKFKFGSPFTNDVMG